MAQYLDPKNDLVFKKIFGEHSDLMVSFLNALLILPEGRHIETIEYDPPELVPENPKRKNTIVDVLCTDNYGRKFIVEMQILWTQDFKNRLLYNAAKAFSRQLSSGEGYDLLQPVYSLGIINTAYDNEDKDFYHYYKILNITNGKDVFPGMEFVMVELPKFNPIAFADRKMAVLWLRFLKEIQEKNHEVAEDLLNDEIIGKAVNICEIGAYTPAELATYEAYWDAVRVERTLANANWREGKAEGIAEGMEIGIKKGKEEGKEEGIAEGIEIGIEKGKEEGIEIGIEKGIAEKNIQTVLESKKIGLSIDIIATITKLTPDEVSEILSFYKKLDNVK
jgi:predicted transposase/invertase (TIGR01784 family)